MRPTSNTASSAGEVLSCTGFLEDCDEETRGYLLGCVEACLTAESLFPDLDSTDYADWLQSNLNLPRAITARPGPLSFSGGFEFWLEFFELLQNPDVEEIVICMGTQIGKTTALILAMCVLSYLGKSTGMLAGPDQDIVRKMRDDAYRLLDNSPDVAAKVPPEHKRNLHAMELNGVPWYLAWAGNHQRLSGKACQVTLATECDRWGQSINEGATQAAIRERTKSYYWFKHVFEGTPTNGPTKDNSGSFIYRAYLKSDQRKWNVKCPDCGHWQELRFYIHGEGEFTGCGGVAGYTTEDGSNVTPDKALGDAYYLCEKGCRVEESGRSEMNRTGQWVPKGQALDAAGNLTGEPEKSCRVAGFQGCSMMGRTVTFGRIAAEYVRSVEDPGEFQNFENNWLGIWHIPKGPEISPNKVVERLRSDVPIQVVPEWGIFLTMVSDVQSQPARYEFPWQVIAWGNHGRGALVDYGLAYGWEEIRTLMTPGRSYKHADGGTLATRWSAIDSGDGGTQSDVYDFARSIPFCLPLKGMKLPPNEGYRLSPIDEEGRQTNTNTGRSLRERVIRGETMLLGVNTDMTQGWLEKHLQGLEKDNAKRFTIPVEVAQDKYLIAELLNEVGVKGRDRHGHPVTTWRRRDANRPNDHRDDIRYGKTLAQFITDNGREWNQLPQRQTVAPPKVAQPGQGVPAGVSITDGGGRKWPRQST